MNEDASGGTFLSRALLGARAGVVYLVGGGPGAPRPRRARGAAASPCPHPAAPRAPFGAPVGMRRPGRVCDRPTRGAGRDPGTPAAVIQWGTRAEQAVVEGRLDTIAARARDARMGSPAVV